MKTVYAAVLIALIILCKTSFAQKTMYKENSSFGLAVNAGAGSFAGALAWSHYHPIGKKKRLKIGYGIRLTNFIGSDLSFITAPAKYTSGKSSIAALFSENIVANLDTVTFARVQNNSLNAGIYLAYTLPYWGNKFELGVNIDAIGFSFGARQNAVYKGLTVTAKPTAFNLLLISDSDKGSLNSEWYVSYWVTKSFSLKAGYEFLFTEYTTDSKIQQLPNSANTNDRFRLKSAMVLLGIQYAPFRK